MNKSDSRFIFLFIKIVLPIILIVIISGFLLYQKIENEKKEIIYENVEILSKLISSVYLFDKRFSSQTEFNLDTDAATLSQINSMFKELKDDDKIYFEYLIAKKTPTHIEFIAYSSETKPPNIRLEDTQLTIPMRKALSGLHGTEIKADYHKNKVFSAYAKIEKTPWGLVIKQPYEQHIAPFKEIGLYTFIILTMILALLYKVLKYYENKNKEIINRSEDRFQQLVESTNDWVWEVNSSGKYQYISKQIENILGYSASELIGKTPFDFMSETEALRVSNIFEELKNNNQKIVNLENINIHKDGHEVTLLSNGSPFFDAYGNLLGFRGIDKDISDLKTKEKELKQLAYYDTLTGLANRKTISIRIEEEIQFALRNDTNSALIFIDLDGFKHINDSLGHYHGDKVLQVVATRLLSAIREFDVASRVGGDEFILLIRGKEPSCEKCQKHLENLIKRLIEKINEPLEINGEINHIGASLGIAFIPTDGDNASEIIKRADSAMYKAKELGKNRASFYNTALQEEADKFLMLKSEILQAFEKNEFIMHYQAQHHAHKEKVIGYEALIRWKHPIKGMVPPSDFLPYIEQLGLGIKLDKYVCSKVQEDLYEIAQADENLHVSINLSAKSFEDDDFLDFIEKKINNEGVDPSRVTLEITEEALIRNIESSFLQKIKKLGFKLSIDDFGTGYSSLAYLSSIEFDEIKLDMSFVQSALKNDKDAQICNFILNMSKALGVDVVAEGVETEEQLAFVKKGGANIIQGYLFAKPEPIEKIFKKN